MIMASSDHTSTSGLPLVGAGSPSAPGWGYRGHNYAADEVNSSTQQMHHDSRAASLRTGHGLHATSNKELPSWTSDQPTGVLRAPAAPATPMVQSLSPLRTLLPRMMTPNRARHELLLKCGCSAHADCRRPTIGDRPGDGPRFGRGRGRSPVPVPDLSGIGDSPPSPSPICRGRGRSPVPDSHRGVRALGRPPGQGTGVRTRTLSLS